MLMNVATIREIYRTRAAILELVAADVAQNATEDELQELAQAVERMSIAFRHKDRRAYIWANIAFHDLNLTVARNLTAKRIVESLLLRTFPLRRRSLEQEGRMLVSLEDHQRIVEAYQDRDVNLAAALIRSNHLSALRNLEKILT